MFFCFFHPEVSSRLFPFCVFQGWGTEKEKGQRVFQGRATEKILPVGNRKWICGKWKCLLNGIYFISFLKLISTRKWAIFYINLTCSLSVPVRYFANEQGNHKELIFGIKQRYHLCKQEDLQYTCKILTDVESEESAINYEVH